MIFKLYITMMPVIISGILNMLFTKTTIYKKYNFPIDGNKTLKDGKRIFGANKTWIGVISMVFFCTLTQVLCGFICKGLNIEYLNYFYNIKPNMLENNILIGLLLGFAYMICELPNSFIKRRIGIAPGKSGEKLFKILFLIIDQMDSMIGVMLILYMFSDINVIQYFIFVIIGAFTHIFVNYILYILKVRK